MASATNHDRNEGNGDDSLHDPAPDVGIISQAQHDEMLEGKSAEKASEPAADDSKPAETQGSEESRPQITIDDKPFSVWTPRQKKLIILMAAFAALFSPLSAQVYFPALDTIATDLHVSNSLINLTVTTYMILQGLAPAFIGGLSDESGRRPAYLACFIIYMLANIGLALENSYAGLLVLRCIQSAGSSGTVALANAVVADIVTSQERGVYVAWLSTAPQAAPSIGPIIGGILAQYAGWHFIFWFLLILSGVVFVPLLVFFPETCRKVVGDGSIPPPKLNRCYTNVLMERKAAEAGKDVPERDHHWGNKHLRFPNPIGTLKILLRPECGLALIFNALILCVFYATLALIPSQFGKIYHFNQLQISLCYIPIGAGTLAAALIRGGFIDARYRYHARRLGMPLVRDRHADLTHFPIERARIEVAIPTLFLGLACSIGFGWAVEYKVNLAAPLIFLFVAGFSFSASGNCISVLIVDINPGRAGAATAASNLTRCWLGAGATALVVPLINAIGVGWTVTLFNLAVVLYSPVLWYIMKQGPKWRMATKEKLEKERVEKERRANIGGEKGTKS